MPDRVKGGFNWIAGSDALPVLGWEVEESHELITILVQAQCRLRIFGFIGFDEQIECFIGILFGLCLPNIVQS